MFVSAFSSLLTSTSIPPFTTTLPLKRISTIPTSSISSTHSDIVLISPSTLCGTRLSRRCSASSLCYTRVSMYQLSKDSM